MPEVIATGRPERVDIDPLGVPLSRADVLDVLHRIGSSYTPYAPAFQALEEHFRTEWTKPPMKEEEVMMEPVVLTLPLPPNRANARGHSRKHARVRREYYATCDMLQALGKVPRAPERRIPRARLAVELKVYNYFDPDGAVSIVKWPLDWCVTRGYLAGDSRHVLTWEGFPEQTIERVLESSVRLTITPVES